MKHSPHFVASLASMLALYALPLAADPTPVPVATPEVAVPATAVTPGPTVPPVAAATSDNVFSIGRPPAGATDPSWAGLAGVPSGGAWEQSPAWKEYSAYLDKRWASISAVRLNAMKTWAATELTPVTARTHTLFYPFSGPDFLYEDTLFPDSQDILMAGLEPVGSIPDLKGLLASGKLGAYLGELQTSLKTILAASFFRTIDMKVDFHNQSVDGLAPALFVFIGRQGYTVDDYEYVGLENDGTITPLKGPDGAEGIRITYHKDATKRTLVYFSVNLADPGQSKHPGFVNLMKKMAPGITYLKAASYLCHDSYFSIIRSAILEDSIGVVEDDSGIPFQYFKPEIWNVKPYGNYTGPIGLFKGREQSDMSEYFKKMSPPPLPFGSGYKYIASESSLIVAIKK